MNNTKTIYLITTFERLEPDDVHCALLGCKRSVGFMTSFTQADAIVSSNVCDLWETCYDYACIEKVGFGLYPFPRERWLYKYNRNTEQYERIDEPAFLKNYGPIGAIG